MKISEEERILRHKRFLSANWLLFAAFSWEHYQKQGRGAVVADERDFIHAPESRYTKIALRYVAENTKLLKKMGGWPGDKEAGWVRTYDPDARVVLFIIREKGGVSSYLIVTVRRHRVGARRAGSLCGASEPADSCVGSRWDSAAEDGGDPTNQPAMAWIPVLVPTNATFFCFDFSLSGDQAEDLLSANIAGTNVFTLEGKYMPTNQPLNSGPIDVSAWAGQSVELFFGLLGGTSTNAAITVGTMRFYQVEPPQLQVEQTGTSVVLSWPAAALGYGLVSAASLADTNWLAVTNTPALRGLRHQVTNSANVGSEFYRLRKP